MSFRILDPRYPSHEWEGMCALTVMAKAPVPGKVKTRLSPPCTPQQAAALNIAFLKDTIATLASASSGRRALPVVCYTPVGEKSAFEGVLPGGTLLLPQREGDFGQRLAGAAHDLLECGFSALCLIDSDSPTVPLEEYASAVRILGCEADSTAHAETIVLGPADDGGYYLIGMREPYPELFEDVMWSTASVLGDTERQAKQLGLQVRRLRTWYDVDDAPMLERLMLEMRDEGEARAPHTAAALAAIGREARSSVGD